MKKKNEAKLRLVADLRHLLRDAKIESNNVELVITLPDRAARMNLVGVLGNLRDGVQ